MLHLLKSFLLRHEYDWHARRVEVTIRDRVSFRARAGGPPLLLAWACNHASASWVTLQPLASASGLTLPTRHTIWGACHRTLAYLHIATAGSTRQPSTDSTKTLCAISAVLHFPSDRHLPDKNPPR